MFWSSQVSLNGRFDQATTLHNQNEGGTLQRIGRFTRRLFAQRGNTGGYILAIISVALALLLRFLVDPWLGNQSPYITFVVAVAVTGLYAGVRPALLATALGTVAAYFSFVPPRYEWGFAGISDAVGFSVYLLAAVAVILLTQARNRAACTAEASLKTQIATERKLLDSEKLFRQFMDHSSACAYLEDEDGHCVYANEAARHEFDITNDRSRVRGSRTGFISDSRLHDEQVLKTGEAMKFEDKTIRPDGEHFWLTSKFPFTDLSGRRFVGGISLDITDRMQAEEIRRKAERLASAGQMASLLAHEINNPLAGLTNLMFLLTQQPLPSPGREFVSQANEVLARINRITAMTLGFYFENDTPARVEICRVIDEVAEMLNSVERFGSIRVEKEFGFDAVIFASSPRVRQLITSLLANAMESEATFVRVRVKLARDWRRGGRSGIRVTIADNGHGIRREVREKVFEPFFSTKGEKGAGLGLWASKAIVQRADGIMRLRSGVAAPRTGTCVRVFLPAELRQAASPGI